MYRDDFRPSEEGISLNQHQPPLPLPRPTANPYHTSTSSYDFSPFENPLWEGIAPNDVSELLLTQSSLSIAPANYSTQTSNARCQQSIAQVTEDAQFLQDLPTLNDIPPPFYNANNMAQGNEQHYQTTEFTEIGDHFPLECTVEGCEDRVFPNQSALKKHEDKHIRPYICPHPSCDRKSFDIKGSLDRHLREVHSSKSYPCPVLSCPRSKKGFNRKYNLWEHQRRIHRLESSKFPQLHSNVPEEPSLSDIGTRNVEQENGILELNDDETNQLLAVPDGEEITGEKNLHTKLRALKTLRAEIDNDIISVERVLNMMDCAY